MRLLRSAAGTTASVNWTCISVDSGTHRRPAGGPRAFRAVSVSLLLPEMRPDHGGKGLPEFLPQTRDSPFSLEPLSFLPPTGPNSGPRPDPRCFLGVEAELGWDQASPHFSGILPLSF